MSLPDDDLELDKFYDARAVADMFNVTIETVRSWIKTSKLPARQINGYWKISRRDLIRFSNHKFGPPPVSQPDNKETIQ